MLNARQDGLTRPEREGGLGLFLGRQWPCKKSPNCTFPTAFSYIFLLLFSTTRPINNQPSAPCPRDRTKQILPKKRAQVCPSNDKGRRTWPKVLDQYD